MVRQTTHPLRRARREAAAARQADRNNRNNEQQLAELDSRPGNSSKERRRLAREVHA